MSRILAYTYKEGGRVPKLLPYPEEGESSMISVDYTTKPTLPSWFDGWTHKEPQTGRGQYDVSTLKHWLHPRQERGVLRGGQILRYLEDNGLLNNCLGIRDLEEIQRKGINFFREHFVGKKAFGWKSVALAHGKSYRDDYRYVPLLVGQKSRVALRWCWIRVYMNASDIALRFPIN